MGRHRLSQFVGAAVAAAMTTFGASAYPFALQSQTPKPAASTQKPAAQPAQPAGPPAQTFATPQAAVAAAVAAATAGPEALMALLGGDAKDLIYSGDAVADQNERAEFVRLVKEKMTLAKVPNDATRMTVLIGNDGFPTAIPLVQRNGKWMWDAVEGRYELLLRRVGSNELDAITVCRGFVEAQRIYAAMDPENAGIHQYAQKIISTAGKRDGLYWPPAAGAPESPIGEAVARAIAQGYTTTAPSYHGYSFKVLTSQGPSAPLGAMDFMVRGHMIGGFALVAWPAQYRVTGVKTFMVGSNGIVYQQDLGPDTVKIASAMTQYDPTRNWVVTNDAREP